jgi:phosphopantetheinyl transferase
MPDKSICLWMRCELSNNFAALESTLTIKQQARHQEFNSATRAMEYLLGRWLCNQLSPHQCEDDDEGLPFLAAAPNQRLNITHSRQANDLFIAAAKSDGPIGIDGEITSRKRNIDALSQHWFSSDELAWLGNSETNKAERFFRLWTAKEALIKSQRGTLAENLKGAVIHVDSNDTMSSPLGRISHYNVADDLILAIADTGTAERTPPVEISFARG